MVNEKVWMRVTDAGSPLCGWDLLCVPMDDETYEVLAARRLDALLGDRPLRFSPVDGMGMWIAADRIEISPLQDDLVELAADAEGLYGEHLETQDFGHTADDGTKLRLTVEVFSQATQAALGIQLPECEPETCSRTWFGERDDRLLKKLEDLALDGNAEELLRMIDGGEDGRAKA